MARARGSGGRPFLEKGKPVYGINTGFGAFSQVPISAGQVDKLQTNLIISPCGGAAETTLPEDSRAGACCCCGPTRCAKGHSGIRPQAVQLLVDMLNVGVHPVVPEQGSLGASGDLAPLAHMALVVMGRGEAVYQGRKMTGAEALAAAGLAPAQLKAKEGAGAYQRHSDDGGGGAAWPWLMPCALPGWADITASSHPVRRCRAWQRPF
ncbi:MAG: aromatic amino acid lyase [Christensenellales bacterium]